MPFKSPEAKKAWQQIYNKGRTGRDTNEYRMHMRELNIARKPFAGVDGEGGNIALPGALFGTSHEYLLLRAGPHTLRTGAPLTWRECLGFLSDLPRDHTYVAYYFEYDVTMMLRGIRPERIKALFKKTNAMMPTEVDGYEIRYLPHKEFAVRRKGQATYTVVSDVGPFFQSSFLHTLEDWDIGTRVERDDIARGKAGRAEFEGLNDETDRYNALEIRLLEDLMTQYAEVCADVGYLPGKWQGPGWLATSVLRTHQVPRSADLDITKNQLLMNLANQAYYGGRFETCMVGPVPGPVYEYDINSAYPYAMTMLPCLRHGSWSRSTRPPTTGTLGFGQVSFDHPEGTSLCNLPVRTSLGGLTFPKRASGVYWSVEVEAAQRAGTIITDSGTWFVYRPGKTCSCQPFGFVPELYRERKLLGGQRGKVLKLGLNSLYGKMAQSIGSPAYANPVYASLITALTRKQLIDAYAGHQQDVVMLATDAVYSRDPLELADGSGLGEWEMVRHDSGLFVVMPGMYFGSDGARSKTRGMNQGLFDEHRADFESAFYKLRDSGVTDPVAVEVTMFTTLKQAAAWNRIGDAGQWPTSTRHVSYNWTNKRAGPYRVQEGFIRTFPQAGGPDMVSVPYHRDIGGLTRLRDDMEGQPDFAKWFQAR